MEQHQPSPELDHTAVALGRARGREARAVVAQRRAAKVDALKKFAQDRQQGGEGEQ